MPNTDGTLSTRLTIGIITLVGIGFGSFLTIDALRESRRACEQAERECESWAVAVAVGLEQAVAASPDDAAAVSARLIARQQANAPMMTLQWLDADGRDRLSFTSPGLTPMGLQHLRTALATGKPVTYYEGDAPYLTHLAPLDNPKGVLRVAMSMAEEFRQIRYHVLTTAGAGVLTLIAVVLLIRLLLGRLVVAPLQTIIQTVNALGAGQLQSRVPTLASNEIGHLGVQVNEMAARCEQADAMLRASEARYRHTIDHAIDAMLTIDPETGYILDVNRATEALTGYTRAELCRMAVWELHPPEEMTRVLALWEYVRTHDAPMSIETLHLRKDGAAFAARVNSGAIRYSQTHVIQRIVRDITEEKRLLDTQRELEIQLLQQAKLSAIGTVAQGIAHNLRSPLTVILGYTDLLRLAHPPPAFPELDTIHKECHRMNQIIETLLIKSRHDQEQDRRLLNLNDLLREEFQFLEADMVFKHEIEKEFLFAEGMPVFEGVYSDFSQSLMNIVRNAIEAMYDRPLKRLTVETGYTAKTLFVRISDTGPGIPQELRSKIFEPFFTTKPLIGTQRAREPTGTGLGLSSCLQLLRPYGATIDVRSQVDAGAIFTVRIPRDDALQGSGAAQEDRGKKPATAVRDE